MVISLGQTDGVLFEIGIFKATVVNSFHSNCLYPEIYTPVNVFLIRTIRDACRPGNPNLIGTCIEVHTHHQGDAEEMSAERDVYPHLYPSFLNSFLPATFCSRERQH